MATPTDTPATGLFSWISSWFQDDDILDASPESIQTDTLNTTGNLQDHQWHSDERGLEESTFPTAQLICIGVALCAILSCYFWCCCWYVESLRYYTILVYQFTDSEIF